jgi:ABC-type lipoprotein release transport system permease subunit
MKLPLSYSYRNLWQRRLTSSLTMGGIALVVFVFAAVLMLANGITQTMVSTGSDNNVVVVRKSAQTEMMSALSRESASVIASMPEVETTVKGLPLSSSEVSIIINLLKIGTRDMGNVIVRGVAAEGVVIRPQLRIVEGRMFQTGSSEIIVGSSIHSRFQGCNIGQTLKFGAREWTISGVFEAEKSGFDSEIWGDAEQLLQAFNRPVFSSMALRLRNVNEFESFKTRLAADPRLQQLEAKREKLFFSEQSETMAAFIRILGLVITIIFSFGAVIGAMITMYASVANRTSEIGTLRALGFKRRSILSAFLIESLFLSGIGGAFGLVIASGLQFVSISTINFGSFSEVAFGFTLSPSIVISSMLFSLFMGFVGGFIPAVRASRLDIITALRST